MWIFLVLMIGFPAIAQADYTRAIVRSEEVSSAGGIVKIFRFLGNNGEQEVVRRFNVPSGGDPNEVQYWVKAQLDDLNGALVKAKDPGLRDGAEVTPAARPPVATSEKELWRKNLYLCDQLSGKTFSGALATDAAALCAGLSTSYRKGFLD